METEIPTVGAIGAGFVGGAFIRGFAQFTDIKIYDKGLNIGKLEDVITQDILFVAVPTPMKPTGEVDASIVNSVLADLSKVIDSKILRKPVVLRSTLPPRFFSEAQKKHKDLEIIYMPEFLTERTADLDFINSTRFIIGTDGGYLTSGANAVSRLFRARFPRTRVPVMSWEAASLVKYGTNNFFTVKLSFFNELYNIAKSFGVEGEEVINEIVQDGRIGRSHFMVPGHDGDFGWGGHCFPKDNRGFSFFAKQLGITARLSDAAWDVNEEVRTNKNWLDMKGRAVSEEE